LPIQTARADAETVRDSLPFVVQAGQRLFIVAEESSEWVVAELRFNPTDCIFTETRRVRYDWPREALGRVLSLTLVGDDLDQDAIQRVSEAFGKWLALQFATPHPAA
jgi:hypothetical protein